MPRPARAAAALAGAGLAGLAQAWAMAAPWDGQPRWWLQLLSIALLAGLTEHSARWQQAAARGWAFAVAWLAGTFWWLYISMHTYGGLHPVLAVLAVAALAGLLALYYAVACGLYRRLAPRGGAGYRALLFAAVWLLAELARAQWFTGFGWGGSAYAHVEGPLAGYAPWIGAFGLAALTAWLGMTLVWLRSSGAGQRLAAVLLLTLPSLVPLAASQATVSAGRLGVALLQGNIPQDEKFQPGTGVPTALRWYAEQLVANPMPLVVTPETALPLLPRQLPPGYWDQLRTRYSSGSQAALVGLPLGSFHEGYTNSVVGLAPGQALWRYDKHHLVPFGEFIPFGFHWFTSLMNIPLGDFNRGDVGQPSFAWQGQRLAANICYEDLFGEELAARFRDPAQAPTIFVNVSNIAWFGDTVAIDQHLAISRMRALEFERPFVRATNTGATAIIDHHGRVTAELPRYARAVLQGEVEGRQGLTLYARWAAFAGLWPWWLLATLVLLDGWRRNRRAAAEAQ